MERRAGSPLSQALGKAEGSRCLPRRVAAPPRANRHEILARPPSRLHGLSLRYPSKQRMFPSHAVFAAPGSEFQGAARNSSSSLRSPRGRPLRNWRTSEEALDVRPGAAPVKSQATTSLAEGLHGGILVVTALLGFGSTSTRQPQTLPRRRRPARSRPLEGWHQSAQKSTTRAVRASVRSRAARSRPRRRRRSLERGQDSRRSLARSPQVGAASGLAGGIAELVDRRGDLGRRTSRTE